MLATLAAETFSHYAPIGVLIIMAVGFGVLNVVASSYLGPSRQGKTKGLVYESGMNPIGTVEPATVAANVVDAIRTQRPYVFTDDHATQAVEARLNAILAARNQVLSD